MTMTILKRNLMVCALAASAISQPTFGAQQSAEADVVYKNGFVYTVDPVRSRAEAFAIRDA